MRLNLRTSKHLMHLRGVTSMNLVTPYPITKAVASSLVAFNSAFNVMSHALLRPKRRSHHEPTYAKTYPTIIKTLTSPSSLQVHATLQRKESSTKTHDLSSSPCRPSSILTSWDEEVHHEHKEKFHSSRKKAMPRETSISLKHIFNLSLKNHSLKENFISCTLEKYDPTCYISKIITSRGKSHHSTYNQANVSSPACLKLSHPFSYETFLESIIEEPDLHSRPKFQRNNFMHLISSRFK